MLDDSTALKRPRERIMAGQRVGSEAVSCFAIHILQTYFSVPGQKSDTFLPQVLGVLESALIAFSFSSLPVSLPSCSGAQLPPLQLPALMLSLKHVLPITALLQHFIYVEHPLGRGVVFEEREVIIDNSNKDNS